MLYQNTGGSQTVIKVRAFSQHATLADQDNANNLSPITKGIVKLYGNAVGLNS